MLYEESSLKKELNFQEKVMFSMAEQLNVKDAKIQALTERNEFLEDLIAELAVQVYSTPPNV